MQAIGFAVRNDAPDQVKQTLGDAFAEAMAGDAMKEFGASKFYVLSGKYGD